MLPRTDMALESEQRASASGKIEGIIKKERRCKSCGLEVTEISIVTEEAAGLIGKPAGKYTTIKCSTGRLYDCSGRERQRAELLSRELRRMIGHPERILVAGLGNMKITPDSLGPRTVSGVLATRHLKRLAKDLDTSELADVSVIGTGVMGQTGIESAEIVRAVCRETEPELVLIIDALACSELSHLGSTVQLCDTGISPGSGVENARSELSAATLGVPCVAIGVPTVTDCAVIAETSGGKAAPEYAGMIVTPKDIDVLVDRSASLIAMGICRALHPALSQEELALLTE
ncbi:MAG: GPR endopeptidase [Ruminococcus sp.]|nr:GPR endopeptidase [Ruminococcus sp.]